MEDLNLLKELTDNLPVYTRLKLHEFLNRARIQNPNDPIFELMILLGIWARYYESIPSLIKEARNDIAVRNKNMLEALDQKSEMLRTFSEGVGGVLDKLHSMQKDFEEQFPAEALAKSIAQKIDERFRALPTTKLEAELRALEAAIKAVTGTPNGLAEKFEKGLNSLQKNAERMEELKLVSNRWPRDLAFAVLGALFLGAGIWFFGVMPFRNLNELMNNEQFISHHAQVGVNDE